MNKIVLEDFNEGNGYYKVNLAYLNKELEDVIAKLNEVIRMVNTLTDVLTSVNLLPIPEEE